MGSCTRRHFLLSTCFLQMITIIERQVFDFLGYMWAPIFVNFFHILFVIFGFYGAYHFRIKYIITYLIWNFLWIGWNAFVICFYLNVGMLDRDSDLLNLGTGSVSWFEVNGYGCKAVYPTNLTIDDPFRPIRPERVDDCLLDYTLVEVVQSGVQCALALLGILGAILISYIFLDEDDRFDFMNGDAKSPQHTVVHPMYVSYTSIPTSASTTMLSNKHHHHHHQQYNHNNQQQNSQTHQTHLNQQTTNHNNNNNNNNNNTSTFLIRTNNKSNNNSNKKSNNSHDSGGNSNSNSHTPNASKNSTLTKMIYNSKNNKIASSTTSILPPAIAAALQQQYYDDSTAKADQLYTNSNRRQQQPTAVTPTGTSTSYQQNVALTPSSSHDNTTSSLSYASLQNSNFNLANSLRRGFGGDAYIGGAGYVSGIASPLSNSQYSLTNSINNNNNNSNTNASGRFARIHSKPRPPKSTSYSSFINTANANTSGSSSSLHRPDIRYTQIAGERLSGNFEECLEDDNFSMDNFKNDDGVTYVPFQKPTPGKLFVGQNNNPSYTSLNSYSPQQTPPAQNASPNNNNNNNNNGNSESNPNPYATFTRDNSAMFLNGNNGILLESGAILHPQSPNDAAISLSPSASRFIYQQNGLPFHPAFSPTQYRKQPPRPTNIPLPTIPAHAFDMPISPSAVTPPPPPAPRPHIFQPRSGHAPYPDVSPDVAEKYAMPMQYVARSPIALRITRRQRSQLHDRSNLTNNSANFCDQIRDAPPGYIDTGYNIVRAKSHDRLSAGASSSPLPQQQQQQQQQKQPPTPALIRSDSKACKDAAPHVNRRSGGRRSDGKMRPRSYCNSMAGGEGVVRVNTSADREISGSEYVA